MSPATLIEESIVVALVCLVFLLHARSAAVAIAILPLGILLALGATGVAPFLYTLW